MDNLWKCSCGYANEGIDENCLACGQSHQHAIQVLAQKATDEAHIRSQQQSSVAHQSTNQESTVRTFSDTNRSFAPGEVDSIASLEQMTAVVWLVIGILQCLSVALFLVGVWNLYVASTRFKRVKQIRSAHPGIPSQVERELVVIILFILINFFLGAVIGVAGAVMDLIVRDRILKARALFETQASTQGSAQAAI